MKLLEFFRGMRQVALREFVGNLKSVRFLIMALVAALVIVGGSYGFSGLLGGGGFSSGPEPVVAWGHAAYAANGSHIATVWVSDPYGAPMAGRPVEFDEYKQDGIVIIGEVNTDGDGFARLDVGGRENVYALARVGNLVAGTGMFFFPPIQNFTVAQLQADFDRDERQDEMAIHVVNVTGYPVPATVAVNGTSVGSVDSHGYLLFDLPVGESNVTVDVGGEIQPFYAYVPEDGGGPVFGAGPDFVLSIIAAVSALVVSLFAIILSFDAVSKERVQGTMDLLLSRPVSRTGVLLGKFLGTFGAVAAPVTLVNLAGIGVISAAAGKGPTGSFAGAFLGLSVLLIAYFILVQLIFSTLAKTSGTAVLFGVLVWLLFNILYPIVTFIIGGALFYNDPAGYFRFVQVSGLGNPVEIYRLLIGLAAPSAVLGGGGTVLDVGAVGTAAVAWLALLFALALWTFHRKAAE